MLLGTDIVEIDRIRKSLTNTHFLKRVFTESERAYLALKKDPAPSAAGIFAAKEAFAKAIGSGFRGFSLADISVEHSPLGAPVLHLSGRAEKAGEGWRFAVSISHCRQYATACVTGWKEEKPSV